MSDPAIEAASQPKNRFVSVTLENPIVRGETKIKKLTLRKPKGSELRGLALPDIINAEVDAMLRLIPRVSDPPLTQDEADNLEAEDLAEVSGAIRGFFMTKAQVAIMDAMIEARQQKT